MCKILYRSEENDNIKMQIDEQYIFLLDSFVIWDYIDYKTIDLYLSNPLFIKTLSKIKKGKVKIYTNKTSYFLFDINQTVQIDSNGFFLLYSNQIDFYYNNKKCNNFNLYLFQKNKLNQEEYLFIDSVLNNQKNKHWFRDQNLLVTNEYNRILNIENIKKIKIIKNKEFDSSIIKVNTGSLYPEKELENLIGLYFIKDEIKKLNALLKYKKKTNQKELLSNLNMCFYGNPGTGKTTVARILTGILYNMNYIKENKCVEVNGLDLKGNTIGQTNIITKNIIEFAKDGVLFIDEAYTLNDKDDKNFGKEVINTFMKEMEDNRTEMIFIFAGYKNNMEQLLDSNIGFRSRIKKYFEFEDYSDSELFQIFIQHLRNKHLYITKEALKKVFLSIKNDKKNKNFGNGRYIRNLISIYEEQHIINKKNTKNMTELDTIDIHDIVSIKNIEE